MDDNQIIISEDYGNIEETTQDNGIDAVAAAEVDNPAIDVTETYDVIVDTNNMTEHNNLHGRNEPGAHKICAIEGLEEALDKIDTATNPHVLYSNKYGVADYYKWANDFRYDAFGYFVSMVPNSDKIQICNGADVFGITIDHNEAGLIGNYDKDKYNEEAKTYDNSYALVATSGLVDVRCTTNVSVGDYVVPFIVRENGNNQKVGMAQVSDSGYGYKVVATNKWGVDPYATIAFNIPADQIDKIGASVLRLGGLMDETKSQIKEAMMLAAEAAQKAEEAKDSCGTTSDTVDDIYDYVTDKIPTIEEEVEQAKKDADEAVKEAIAHADKTTQGAMEYADEKFAEANRNLESAQTTLGEQYEKVLSYTQQNADEIYSLVASIDTYSVGEYSQSWGLTLSQARDILKEGMFYMPTEHGSCNRKECDHEATTSSGDHYEEYSFVYSDGKTYTFKKEFKKRYYYVWDKFEHTIEATTTDGDEATTKSFVMNDFWWDQREDRIAFNLSTLPSPSLNSYWYINGTVDGEAKDAGYESYTLYVSLPEERNEDGAIILPARWIKVNTIEGNVNNRLTSIIRQTANEVAIEVSNAQKSIADVKASISESDSRVDSLARWRNGEEVSDAIITQRSDDKGAEIVIQTVSRDGETVTSDASLVLKSSKNNPSSLCIAADQIDFDTGSYTISADHIDLDAGDVNINASNIKLEGFVTANKSFTIDECGNMAAASGQIGGWEINKNGIYKGTTALIANGNTLDASLVSSGQSLVCLAIGADKEANMHTAEVSVQAKCNEGAVHDTICLAYHVNGEILDVTIISVKTPGIPNDLYVDFDISDEGNGYYAISAWNTDGPYTGPVDVVLSVYYAENCSWALSKFRVLEDGSLYANAAQIAGNITATGGEIGGWKIDDSGITKGEAGLLSTDVYAWDSLVERGKQSNIRLYAGGDLGEYEKHGEWFDLDYDLGDEFSQAFSFEIDIPKDITMLQVNLETDKSSFVIPQRSAALRDGQTITVTATFKATVKILEANKGRIYVKYKYQNPHFAVLDDGSLYANAAIIEGNIAANSGSIAGFTIDDQSIRTETYGFGTKNTEWRMGLRAPAEIEDDESVVLAIGYNADDEWETAPFYVTSSGSACIKSGTIGSCYFGEGKPIINRDILSPDIIKIAGTVGFDENVKLRVNYPVKFSPDAPMKLETFTSYSFDGDFDYNDLNYERENRVCDWSFAWSDSAVNPPTSWTSSSELESTNISISEKSHFWLKCDITVTWPEPMGTHTGSAVYYIGDYSGYLTTLKFGSDFTIGGGFVRGGANEIKFESEYGNLVGTWKLNGSSISTTSDKNLKHDIMSLEDSYSDLFDALNPVKFKYNNGTSDRYHTGFIAQEVRDATVNSGLTTNDFAAYVEFVNEDGGVERGLRYEEFVSLNTWQIQKLKARVSELENKLALLTGDN